MTFASAVYWSLFVVAFLAVAIWESVRPKRELSWPAGRRWGRHGLLLAIAGVISTVVFRVSPIAMATAVSGSRFGILSRPWLPFLVRCAATIILLDLLHYATHRAFHSFAVLWHVHEVHHSDPDFDVSTSGRFHPIEVVLVQGATLGAVALLAPPPVAVFASSLLAMALNFFSHANAALPKRLDALVRAVLVTPDMHRIHHSEEIAEQSRNFGQTFPWWDRLFGTYLADPAAGEKMTTGITGIRGVSSLGLGFMLAEPFRRSVADAPAANVRPEPDNA